MAHHRTEYLLKLAAAIDAARELADEWPSDDGSWGGGHPLTDGHAEIFGYGNTSDLLSDLAATVREAAEA